MLMCIVCDERPCGGAMMCRQCGRSYDRMSARTSDIQSILEWAAKRARWFERRRKDGQRAKGGA